MKITFARSVTEDIILPEATVTEVVERYLRQLVSPGEYLRKDADGKTVVKQDDPDHYHGSISEHYVRDATEVDLAAFKLLEHIRSKKYESRK